MSLLGGISTCKLLKEKRADSNKMTEDVSICNSFCMSGGYQAGMSLDNTHSNCDRIMWSSVFLNNFTPQCGVLSIQRWSSACSQLPSLPHVIVGPFIVGRVLLLKR